MIKTNKQEVKKSKKKSMFESIFKEGDEDFLCEIFTCTWIASWFVSIWCKSLRLELFLTGVFSIILAMLLVNTFPENTKEKNKL